MAVKKIPFANKILGQLNPASEIKKLTYQNVNDIKDVIDNNADEIIALQSGGGASGIDDVLAEAQALTAPRTIDAAGNQLLTVNSLGNDISSIMNNPTLLTIASDELIAGTQGVITVGSAGVATLVAADVTANKGSFIELDADTMVLRNEKSGGSISSEVTFNSGGIAVELGQHSDLEILSTNSYYNAFAVEANNFYGRAATITGKSTYFNNSSRLTVSDDIILSTWPNATATGLFDTGFTFGNGAHTFTYAGGGGNRHTLKQDIMEIGGIAKLSPHLVAGLPLATLNAGSLAYVTDAAGGASIAQSDGVSWLSLKTGIAV